MSKKMLKRSLALGALMAFVITGSAMAADPITTRVEISSSVDKTYTASDTFTVNTGDKSGGAIYNDGGNVTITGSQFLKNSAYDEKKEQHLYGGAIYTEGGTVGITDAKFEGNILKNTTGTFNQNGRCTYGGAIYTQGTKLTIVNTNFINNMTQADKSKNGQGGAIYINGGSVSITGGSFEGNKAQASESNNYAAMGGAIYNGGTGSLIIDGTTFVNNKGNEGGAIVTNGGPVEISNAKFKNNIATMGGGAINIQPNKEVTLKGTNNFEGNEAVQGGAVKLYSNSVLEINGTATFTGNKDADGANDIHNDGIVNIKKDAVVTLDGGMDGAGTTTIAGTLNGVFTATEDSANTVAFEKGGAWNMTGDSTVAKITGSGVNVNGDAVLTINGPLGNNGAVDVKELNIKSATNGISVYGDMTVTADKITVDGANSSIYTEYPSDKDTTASHLTINVKDSLKVTGTGHGINSGTSNAGSSVIINGENAEIEIKVGENAVVARGGDKGSIEITGKKVTLESTGTGESVDNEAKGHGIYAQGANSNIVVNATESLTVTAVEGKYAVYADNSTNIDLDGGENTYINGRIFAYANDTEDDVNIDVDVNGKNIYIDANGSRGVQASGSCMGGDNVNVTVGSADTQKVEIKNTTYGLYSQYYGSVVKLKAMN